jgi:hypothetical protein
MTVPKRSTKNKTKPLNWWMMPKKDQNEQWWWGYQKVRLVILPDQDRLKAEFLAKHNAKLN